MVKFSLTFVEKSFKRGKRLGDRIGVIRRVLAPLTEVRILVPQPKSILFRLIFNAPFRGKRKARSFGPGFFSIVLPGGIIL